MPTLQGHRLTLWFSASVDLLGNPPAYELRPLMIARDVLDPEAYVGSDSLVIVVGVVHCHVLAPVLPREGLVGNLLREYHRNLGSSFSLPAHRKPMAGLSFVKSGTDCKYSAFIPKIKFDTYGLSKSVCLHLRSLPQVCLLRRS
jgi:hypothetical protein